MDIDGEDVVVSSSSDSESEADEEYQQPSGNSAQELTLQDDEKGCLMVPDEALGEADQETEDLETPFEEEGEGEGTDEIVPEPVVDLSDKKDIEKDSDKKKKKKKKKKFLYICLTNCKYDVVRRTSRKFGFKEVSDDEDWSLYWTDFSVALERVMDMKKYQGRTKKINHFPGMNEICRKDLLARNLNRMMKMFPKEYNIFPKTWVLPADYGDFQAYTRQKKNKTYILKPESGCQGRGIWITKAPKDIKPHEHMICQVYMNRPYLIDGFKFDFRIYTLVTSCDPLRIFVFKDGLARFATNKYCEPTNSNTENVFMHLTNYAINKNSEDFVRDDDEAGSKRRISTINRYLQKKGVDIDKMWNDIDDTIIKTIISAHSVLKHNYRTCFPNHVKGSACFEILGFDVLLDRKLRPYVVEVNHSPSFSTDAQIDREIKGTLIWDTLGLINFGAIDRRRCMEEERRRIKDRLLGKNTKKETKEELEFAQQQYQEQLERYENSHMGNFRRIFPCPDCDKYDKYFHSSGTLFQETAAFRARSELARQQREEILRKKEKMDLMLKKGKKGEGGVRPESPVGRRKRPVWHRNPTMHFKPRLSQRVQEEERGYSDENMDTAAPMDILEEEELERISGLLQRDNLVRGLGIVEHVYRLLHCTPGTVGVVKPDIKPQPLPLVRPKDRQYYKKLLDRYFGTNHALSRDTVDMASGSGSGSTTNSSLLRPKDSGVNRTWNATASAHINTHTAGGGGGDEAGGGSATTGGGSKMQVRVSMAPFPQVRLTFASNNNNNVAALSASAVQRPYSDFDLCEGDLEGVDRLAASQGLPVPSHCPPNNSTHIHYSANPNPAPVSFSCQHANPAFHANFVSANAVTNVPMSPSVVSISDVGNPTVEEEGEMDGFRMSMGSEDCASHHPFASRVHTLPQPFISPFSASLHPSQYSSNNLSQYSSNNPSQYSSNHTPRYGSNNRPHPTVSPFAVSRIQKSSQRYSRFSVRAPLCSTLLQHQPFSSPSSSHTPLTLSLSHAPATATAFRIPASSGSPFSPVGSSPSLPPPESQSVSVCTSQPGPGGGQRWPIKSKSLGNINERTIPSYQCYHCYVQMRTKMARKPLAGPGLGVGGRGAMVVQESELRSMTGLMDTEAERNRLLARNGYSYQQSPSYATTHNPGPSMHQGGYSSGYQSDWRSDTSTPARTRVLSAHRQGRQDTDGLGLGVQRYIAQHPSHGLSVVSAPAPVIQRPDILPPGMGHIRQTPPVAVHGDGLDMLSPSRSTKSQRVRGASNSMRLKQMEMRENRAFVYS